MGVFIGQKVVVLLRRYTTIEDCSLNLRHILAEPGILVLNLICQLSGVAHNQDRAFSWDRLDLLERGEDEDCGLPKAGFRLT